MASCQMPYYPNVKCLFFREVAKQKADYVSLSIEDSHEALKIVNSLDDFLDFELIKGNMDDVFLNVTGHTEVTK